MKEDKIIGEEFSLPEEADIIKRAKKRVGFKIHIIIYILVCIVMWLCWGFIFQGSDLNKQALNTILFITLIWGVCAIFHYLIVYKWDKTYLEKEVKRLKKQQEKQQQQIEEYSNQDKI